MGRTVLSLFLLVCLPGVLLEGIWLRGEVPYTKNGLESTALPWSRLHPPDLRAPNLNTGDALLQMIPWDMTLRREWKSLRPPLWNPYAGIGAPLVGNPQNQVLDPTRLVALAGSARQAPAIRAWLRLVLAGWFMFGLLRHFGAGRIASLLAATAFQLGGYSLPWLQHPTAEVALFLPALVWAGDALLRSKGRGAFCALAVVYALQFMAGHGETTLFTTTLAAIFWIGIRFRAGLTAWLKLGLALLTGGLLTAPLLLTFLEYLSLSSAFTDRAETGDVLLHISAAATFAVPHLFGWPLTGDWTGAINTNETVAYFGVVPWLLIPLAFIHRPYRHLAVVGVVAVAFSAMVAYGMPGLTGFIHHLPGFNVSANRRLILGIAFGGIVVGALGLDVVCKNLRPGKTGPLWVAVSIALAGILGSAAAAWWSEAGREAVRQAASKGWWTYVVVTGIALVLITAVRKQLVGPRWALLLVVLLVVDLRLSWGGYHSTVRPDRVLPTTPAIEALQARVAPGDRVLALGVKNGQMVLPPNTAQAFGLAELKIYDALGNEDFYDLFVGAIKFLPAMGIQGDYLNLFGARWIAIPVPLERIQSAAVLNPGQENLILYPEGESTTALEVLSYLIGCRSVEQDRPVAVLEARDEHLTIHRFEVRAGRETAEGALCRPGFEANHRAVERERLFDIPHGSGGVQPCAVYRARFPWLPEWGKVTAVRIRYTHAVGRLRVEGIGFLDSTGRSTLDEKVRPFFRGELYLYENHKALPRAFLVHEKPALLGLGPKIRPAAIRHYECDRVVITGEARKGEILVLSDGWFPGWEATLESAGRTTSPPVTKVLKAFRSVAVPEGPFTLTFAYNPRSFTLGLGLFPVGLMVLVLAWVFPRRRGRDRQSTPAA